VKRFPGYFLSNTECRAFGLYSFPLPRKREDSDSSTEELRAGGRGKSSSKGIADEISKNPEMRMKLIEHIDEYREVQCSQIDGMTKHVQNC